MNDDDFNDVYMNCFLDSQSLQENILRDAMNEKDRKIRELNREIQELKEKLKNYETTDQNNL